MTIRILHTSDWHLGRSLYGRRRYDEFAAFLDWLAELIEIRQIDVLLVAGDVFDGTAPSNRAQELYYRFLCRVAGGSGRQVVVTAGNHDSPAFLDAPKELLAALNIHVLGTMPETVAEEVLLFPGSSGEIELMVGAVPYLRDRDLRWAEAGESPEDKERKLIAGIREHYRQVCAAAEGIRAQTARPLPLVVMGHLFTAGGRTVEGDGVRELYVGSLAHVAGDIFPAAIDYLALGHLHLPQRVGSSELRRYCGSPLPMGFGEARQQKQVVEIEFTQREVKLNCIPVPSFQELEQVRGDWSAIERRIKQLRADHSRCWLEVLYEGEAVIDRLPYRLEDLIAGSSLEILRVQNRRLTEQVLRGAEQEADLAELDPEQVFRRCLELHQVPAGQQPELIDTYREVLVSLELDDRNQE